MENREHFGSLTARMKAFREEVLDEKPYVDAERAILATASLIFITTAFLSMIVKSYRNLGYIVWDISQIFLLTFICG